MIIDTHAHYDDEQFDADREALLGMMQENGIGKIVNASAAISSWDSVIELTRRYPFVYGMIGVHPDEVGGLDEEKLFRMEQLLKEEDRRGRRDRSGLLLGSRKSRCAEWFVRQLELAEKLESLSISTAGMRRRIQWRSCVNMEKDCAGSYTVIPIRRRWRQNMSRWVFDWDRRCCHI